jgi:hypothetical protein
MSIEKIRECIRNPTKESIIIGYTNVFNLLTERNGSYTNNINLIINMFEIESYTKAKKYNNIYVIDRIKYDIEVNIMLKICEYITRYYTFNENKPNLLNNIINNSWNKAEELKSLSMIGCICVQYNLPAVNPCWMANMIGSYIVKYRQILNFTV